MPYKYPHNKLTNDPIGHSLILIPWSYRPYLLHFIDSCRSDWSHGVRDLICSIFRLLSLRLGPWSHRPDLLHFLDSCGSDWSHEEKRLIDLLALPEVKNIHFHI